MMGIEAFVKYWGYIGRRKESFSITLTPYQVSIYAYLNYL